MFRKGATHKLKPSPSDITTIRLSNSIIGLLKSLRNMYVLWTIVTLFFENFYTLNICRGPSENPEPGVTSVAGQVWPH